MGRGRGRRAGIQKSVSEQWPLPTVDFKVNLDSASRHQYFSLHRAHPSLQPNMTISSRRPPKQLNHSSFAGANNIMQFQCLLQPYVVARGFGKGWLLSEFNPLEFLTPPILSSFIIPTPQLQMLPSNMDRDLGRALPHRLIMT